MICLLISLITFLVIFVTGMIAFLVSIEERDEDFIIEEEFMAKTSKEKSMNISDTSDRKCISYIKEKERKLHWTLKDLERRCQINLPSREYLKSISNEINHINTICDHIDLLEDEIDWDVSTEQLRVLLTLLGNRVQKWNDVITKEEAVNELLQVQLHTEGEEGKDEDEDGKNESEVLDYFE